MDLELKSFFGICTLINFGLLVFSTVMLVVFKDIVTSIHTKLFGIHKKDLIDMYFEYLGNYKILIFVFNFVPWLSLVILD